MLKLNTILPGSLGGQSVLWNGLDPDCPITASN